MGVPLNLIDIQSGFLSAVAFTANNTLTEEALAKTLSRVSNADDNAMEVDLDMGLNSIFNVQTDPTDSSSLLTVADADARYLNTVGDTLTGNLSAGGFSLTNLGTPLAPNSAARLSDVGPDSAAALRIELSSTSASEGASLVSMEGGPSVEDAVLDRVIRVTSVSAMEALEPINNSIIEVASYHSPGFYLAPSGGGTFVWLASEDKSKHDGGVFIDPDAPFPSSFENTTQVAAWFDYSGTGTGVFVRTDQQIYVDHYGAASFLTDNKRIFEQAIDATKGALLATGENTYPQGAALRASAVTYNVSGELEVDFSLCLKGENSNKTYNTLDAGTVINFAAGGFNFTAGHFRFYDVTITGQKTGTIDVLNGVFGNAGMIFNNTRGEFWNTEIRDFDCGLVYRKGAGDSFGGAYRSLSDCRILRNEYNIVILDYVTDSRFHNCHIVGNPEDAGGNKRGYVYINNTLSEGYMSANFNNCLLEGLGYVPAGFDYKDTAGVFVGGKNTHVLMNGGYSESVSFYVEKPATLTRSIYNKDSGTRTFGDGFSNISGSYARSVEIAFPNLGDALWVAANATANGFIGTSYRGWGFTIGAGTFPQIQINDFSAMREIAAESFGDLLEAESVAVTIEIDYNAPAGVGARPQLRAFSDSAEIDLGYSGQYFADDIQAPAGNKRLVYSTSLDLTGGNLSYFRPRILFDGAVGDQIIIRRVKFYVHA